MKIRNAIRISENEIDLEIEHPEYGWIPYTAMNNSGEEEMQRIWDQAYSENLEFDISVLKGRAELDANISIQNEINKLTHKYTDDERKLWDIKRQEAENVLKGGSSEMLQVEAEIEGEPIVSLAKKIIDKNNEYRIAVVRAEAMKKKMGKDFASLKTLEDIEYFKSKYLKGS